MVTRFYKFFFNLIPDFFYNRLLNSLKYKKQLNLTFLSDKYIYKSIDKGYSILYKEYNFGKKDYVFSNFNHDLTSLSLENLKNIHSFNWLQDLKIIDTQASSLRIFDLIDTWIDNYGFYRDKVVFEYNVLASRIFNWLTSPNITNIKEQAFKDKIFKSLSFQIKLFIKLYNIKYNQNNLLLSKTLFAIGKSTNTSRLINTALEDIINYLRKAVLADGGILDKSPSTVLAELEHILFVFRALDNDDTSFKSELRTFVDKIIIFIKSVSYKDGGLGVFNGGYEEDSNKINFLLSMGNMNAKVFNNLRYSGYLNISSNNIDVMLKTNNSFPDNIKNNISHYNNSILSQEILLYGERIFVNNSTNSNFLKQKLKRCEYSTLLFYDKNNNLIDMPSNLSYHECKAVPKSDQYYDSVFVTYKGLEKSYGLSWYKSLSLAKNNNCLLGEDLISLDNRSCIGKVILKFILHPSVIVKSNGIDGNSIILEVNNEEWIFQATNMINIENELYQAIKDELFPTISINIAMDMNNKKSIEWSLAQKDFLIKTSCLHQKYT